MFTLDEIIIMLMILGAIFFIGYICGQQIRCPLDIDFTWSENFISERVGIDIEREHWKIKVHEQERCIKAIESVFVWNTLNPHDDFIKAILERR